MRTIHITLTDAVDGLLGVVRKFGPDHIAQDSDGSLGCTYIRRDEYGYFNAICIVGQYIAALGFLGALVKNDNGTTFDQHGACVWVPQEDRDEFYTGNPEIWDDLASYGLTFDDDAARFLYLAQTEQDGGATWGEAVERAIASLHDEKVKRLGTTDAQNTVKYALAGMAPAEPLADWEKELLAGQ